MKTIIISFCLLFCLTSQAQQSLLTIKEARQVPGASKEQMFLAVRKWFVQTFPNTKQKFEIEDKEAGELSAKGTTIIPVSYMQGSRKDRQSEARFNANFVFKDGICQYEFTNIDVQKGSGNSKFYKLWADKKEDQSIEEMKTGAKKYFEDAANSLKTVLDNLN